MQRKKNKKERSSGCPFLWELNIFIFHAILLRKLVYMSLSLISLKWAYVLINYCMHLYELDSDLIWLIVFIHILVTTKRIKSETGNKKSNMNHQSYKLKPSISNHKWGFIKLKDNHVETIIIVFFHKFRIVHIKQAALIK